ncbi:FAD-dependent oxidoreductase [Methylobacterium soli]|uniref:FAD-dependent monooxygenase n=1 Tax=Methylobacterium soli TaxID=553447 RepID=A0A6L3T174_9HYPH|nr:NAD(P)/FAD-dependent oxidoreductase [Methylobacterium soli]KAB1080294.1 FAD-dependent monooxygenase [Methylobacterium soli]GJE44731.1 6-hydroxy-3-succinoylpyridine 3-monooxygenase HspB [Methylobacterium soli]
MTQHVIIAGGGPTGLLTALGLARAGTRVTIIEAERGPNDSPRALVYHYPVLPHLEALGLLEDCIAAGFVRQDYAWRVYDTGEMIPWTLRCLDGHVPHPYALHLGQGELSRVVSEHLRGLSNVEIRYATTLKDCTQHATGVTVRVEAGGGTEVIEGQWLIGADGAGSVVRREVLKLNFFGITWPERYVATNTRVDLDGAGYANCTMQVDDVYGSVICKIDRRDLWRVTFMEDPSLPAEGIEARIQSVLAELLPRVGACAVASFSPYRMHQRVADRMRVGRVLLVGDAGHITNPTGGLGLTGGMFDSFALVEALGRVIHDGASHDILEFYERDRRQKFIELVSPRASANKQRLYRTAPGTEMDDWIAEIRAIGRNPDAMREAFRFTEQLKTVF